MGRAEGVSDLSDLFDSIVSGLGAEVVGRYPLAFGQDPAQSVAWGRLAIGEAGFGLAVFDRRATRHFVCSALRSSGSGQGRPLQWSACIVACCLESVALAKVAGPGLSFPTGQGQPPGQPPDQPQVPIRLATRIHPAVTTLALDRTRGLLIVDGPRAYLRRLWSDPVPWLADDRPDGKFWNPVLALLEAGAISGSTDAEVADAYSRNIAYKGEWKFTTDDRREHFRKAFAAGSLFSEKQLW